jgi:hypothetical protein
VQTPEEIAARSALDAEKSAYWQRVFSQQRTQIETSKLVATVGLALAATLVGTTMQVQSHGPWDPVACVLIGVALLGVVLLLIFNKTPEVNVDEIATRHAAESDTQILRFIAVAQRCTTDTNETTVSNLRKMMFGQRSSRWQGPAPPWHRCWESDGDFTQYGIWVPLVSACPQA